MSNRKLKVSFEITDNWNLMDFRNYIKFLLSSDEEYELFLISNDDNSAYISAVGLELGMDSAHIIICNFTDDKVSNIVSNHIDIHFDNLQTVIMLVNETTDAKGIMVTRNLNKYYLKSDYVLVFERSVLQIRKDENEA